MVKAVLLDVGGVILVEDPEYEAWEAFIAQELRNWGIEVTTEDVRRTVKGYVQRLDQDAWLAALWHYLRPDVRRFRDMKERFRAFQREWLSRREHRLRDGIRDAIAVLRSAGYILALAANQDERTGQFLRRSGITEGFAWDLVSAEMGIGKPAPLFFRIILDAIDVPPSQAVMVGDRLDNDILPARILGMWTVRMLAGPYRDQIPPTRLHCPHRTVIHPRALPEAIASLCNSTDQGRVSAGRL
ncbi:hypothetical protein DRJ27_00960 [Candidatus Acetothermia bacterium]|nr:MAG: hypothetical protein DRJ27_00960 [Candidatus Acetothermia bacterium]